MTDEALRRPGIFRSSGAARACSFSSSRAATSAAACWWNGRSIPDHIRDRGEPALSAAAPTGACGSRTPPHDCARPRDGL